MPLAPLPLRDGRYLRVAINLFLADTADGRRLKVSTSSFQYQEGRDPDPGDSWIFRYDYLREPPAGAPHSPMHLQVNADLRRREAMPDYMPLNRVHFPTSRVSIEAVIRLLAEEFHVECAERPEVWRRMLTESESLFKGIAHEFPSGPAA